MFMGGLTNISPAAAAAAELPNLTGSVVVMFIIGNKVSMVT